MCDILAVVTKLPLQEGQEMLRGDQDKAHKNRHGDLHLLKTHLDSDSSAPSTSTGFNAKNSCKRRIGPFGGARQMMPGSDKRIYDFPATGPPLVPTKKSSEPCLLCRRV